MIPVGVLALWGNCSGRSGDSSGPFQGGHQRRWLGQHERNLLPGRSDLTKTTKWAIRFPLCCLEKLKLGKMACTVEYDVRGVE